MAAIGQQLLHLGVHGVGVSLGAVAHEADGGLAVIIGGGGLYDGIGNRLEILIGGQQRLADGDSLKGIGILGNLVHQVAVLQAVHQMGGLNHQILDPVGDGTVQGLAHIVDDLAVPVLHMVDDDLAGEASSHGILREGLLHSRLDGANGQAAVVVVAGAKADHQQLALADLILVAGIIQRSIAGFVVFLILFPGHSGLGMGNQQILDLFQLPEAVHQALHLIAGGLKGRLPGALFIACHVVVGMVAGHDHQGLQHHALIAAGLNQSQNVLQRGSGLYGAHKIVCMAALGQHLLHLGVHGVGLSLSAVAHEADGGLAIIIGGGGLYNGIGHDLEVLVRGQQGQANGNGFKSVGILGHLVHQVVVLQAVHQMGGLNHQILDPVGDGTVQGLAHIVDDLAVPVLHMVDDDLAGEASSHGILRESLLHGCLNGANGQAAVIVVAGAKADHQQLVLADLILVARIVQGSVAGVIVFSVVFGGSSGRIGGGRRLCGLRLAVAACKQCRCHGKYKQQSQQFLHFHVRFLLHVPERRTSPAPS